MKPTSPESAKSVIHFECLSCVPAPEFRHTARKVQSFAKRDFVMKGHFQCIDWFNLHLILLYQHHCYETHTFYSNKLIFMWHFGQNCYITLWPSSEGLGVKLLKKFG